MKQNTVLALDFGGTKLTAATVRLDDLADPEPQWIGHERRYSAAGADAQSDLAAIIQMGRVLLDGQTAAAVGVSFGGPADHASGRVRRSDHVPGWQNQPLRKILSHAFSAPVSLDNDANAGALGEHRYGAGRSKDSLLYVTVSTGVGGGWIIESRLWRGADGMAGEIGHMVIAPQGPRCLCGKRGCVERMASGPFMAHDAQQILDRFPQRGRLLRAMGGDKALSGKNVAQAAEEGDDVALEILRSGAAALGIGIGNAASLINPQLVILGGGVTHAGDLWWRVVREQAGQTAIAGVNLEVVPAALGDDAPLWGAAVLGRELLNS